MSIWISDIRAPGSSVPAAARRRSGVWRSLGRSLAAVLGVLALAGCLDAVGQGREASEVVRVLDGQVAIGGPLGYCVDPVGTRDNDAGAFVLLGSCAGLSRDSSARHPGRLAVLTASVTVRGDGPAVAEITDEMASYFGSTAGRAILSRSGQAETVVLRGAQTRDGALFLRISDSAGFDGPEVGEEYLRVVFDVGDSIVMLSVLPLAEQPMEPRALQSLLDAFRDRVLRENR